MAKPKSVCISPPNSSALYAITSTGPATMNGISVQPTRITPNTPSTSAPSRPAATTATNTAGGGVRGQADREEERQYGRDQVADQHPRRQRGADHHVGQVPRGVRRVQQRPPIPPPPRPRRV